MDQLLTNSELPDRHLINEEMIAETARQIEKDLRLSVLETGSPDANRTAFDRLFSALLPHVAELLAGEIANLPQNLYQVDLPERYVDKALESIRPAEVLTEAIIKRCFQKVVLRRLYSKGKND